MTSPSLKRLARRSNNTRFFHAAQVLRGGAVISQGYNHDTMHAEIMAMNKARRPGEKDGLKGATMVSIRVTRSGKLANAKPCAECWPAIVAAGVKKLIFSTREGTLETVRL